MIDEVDLVHDSLECKLSLKERQRNQAWHLFICCH